MFILIRYYSLVNQGETLLAASQGALPGVFECLPAGQDTDGLSEWFSARYNLQTARLFRYLYRRRWAARY